MNRSNRSLLVLFNHEFMSPNAIEHEVDMLHELLYKVEHSERMVVSHEIIDLNKHKINNSPAHLRNILRERRLKGFVFLNNKN